MYILLRIYNIYIYIIYIFSNTENLYNNTLNDHYFSEPLLAFLGSNSDNNSNDNDDNYILARLCYGVHWVL